MGVPSAEGASRPRVPTTIRRIAKEQARLLRHAVLWPSIPIHDQLLPYDSATDTIHLGAFLSTDIPSLSEEYLPGEDQQPISVLTLVVAAYSRTKLPERLKAERGAQLRKFAVLPDLQGMGIGREMMAAAVDVVRHDTGEPTLLHLDARTSQVMFYQRLGFEVLDPVVFFKRGATGTGPEVRYVSMGRLV